MLVTLVEFLAGSFSFSVFFLSNRQPPLLLVQGEDGCPGTLGYEATPQEPTRLVIDRSFHFLCLIVPALMLSQIRRALTPPPFYLVLNINTSI